MTLGQLAEAMGISPKQLASLESEHVPTGEVMAKVVVWALGQDDLPAIKTETATIKEGEG
jgi:transcriptional regulator with XRE-family HTH domain